MNSTLKSPNTGPDLAAEPADVDITPGLAGAIVGGVGAIAGVLGGVWGKFSDRTARKKLEGEQMQDLMKSFKKLVAEYQTLLDTYKSQILENAELRVQIGILQHQVESLTKESTVFRADLERLRLKLEEGVEE